jgi:exonuclease III
MAWRANSSHLVALVVIMFAMASEGILIWNVRGLNTTSHYDALGQLVSTERPSIVCIQETKLDVISLFDVIQLLGHGFDYSYHPAAQTRGGVLVAWRSSIWSTSSSSIQDFSVSVCLKHGCRRALVALGRLRPVQGLR